MHAVLRQSVLMAVAGAMVGLTLSGCSGPSAPETAPPPDQAPAAAAVDDHSGWWCSEHGVPEEICGQCNPKVAAEFRQQGDWCEEHNRPKSQCFLCAPDLEAKFAAQYEAKFGTQPPKPRD